MKPGHVARTRPHGAQPARAGRRRGPRQDPRGRRRLHRARRSGPGPDGRRSRRPPASPPGWCTTTSTPRSGSSPRCSTTPTRPPPSSTSAPSPSAGDGPAARLSSFLDRCLPSDEQLRARVAALAGAGAAVHPRPDLAKVGAELYEDLYVTLTGSSRGRGGRRLRPSPATRGCRGDRGRAPTARRPGAGRRPDLGLDEARATSPPPSACWSATTARSPRRAVRAGTDPPAMRTGPAPPAAGC